MDRKFFSYLGFMLMLALLAVITLGGTAPASAAQGDWRSYDTTYSNLPAGYVNSIRVIGNQIWFGSSEPEAIPPHDGGISKFISELDWEDNFENYDAWTGHLTTNHVWDMDSDSSGNLWVACTRGVRKFNPYTKSSTIIYEDWDQEDTINVVAIAVRGNNDVWFATTAKLGQAASLWNYKNGTLVYPPYNHTNPLPGASGDPDHDHPATYNINCISFDVQGNMWIGLQDQSAAKYDFTAKDWINYTGQFPNSRVNDIDFDSSGKVWFSTSSSTGVGGGGAYLFDPLTSTWTLYDSDTSGLGNDNVMSMALSSVDGIWFGTTQGAYLWNESKPPSKQWRVFTTSNTEGNYPTWKLPDNTVYDIKYGNFNNIEYIWFGTGGGGVGRLLADSIRNKPPTASFIIDPSFGDCTETMFTFDATSSSDPEDILPLLQVRWDWENDGIWDTPWSPVKIVEKVFAQDGKRTVRMQVRDTEDLKASTTRTMVCGVAQPGVPGLGPYNSPSKIWYFAEGYTGPGFEEWLTLQNPGSKTAHVTITYMFRGGGTQDQTLYINPNSRETVSVNDAVGFNREVAAVVNATEPILAERPMYYAYIPKYYHFLDRYEGGHNVIGSPFKYTEWFFAEGYTGRGFDEWLCILNDNYEPAHVTITYMYRKGGTHTQHVTVGARTRETISVNEAAGMNKELSVKINSSIPIVAERPMYFGYHGYGSQPKWNGGHDVVGTTTSSNSWYFAEGYTGSGFEEWLTIQNPNPSPVTVNITYTFRGGGMQNQSVYLTGNSRETIDVNSVVGPNKEVSAMVQCSQRVIVERPMYFNYKNSLDGGDVKMGAYIAWEYWYFAEGYTGPGFDEWITLLNPQGVPADVTITYMFRGGGTQNQTLTVGPYSRETIEVNSVVGPNKELSATVSSSQPIVAERPMYFRYQGKYSGGF